jgi:hypothetical protein
MRNSANAPLPPYQPITLNLTFETLQEARLFTVLLASTVSIPQILLERESVETDDVFTLQQIMTAAFRTMNGALANQNKSL